MVLFIKQVVQNRRIVMVSLITITMLFSYWTYERNKIWQDELTLWKDVQQKSPNKARANLNLGLAYVEKNRAEEAITYLKKALYLYEQLRNEGKYVKSTGISLCLRLLGNAYLQKGEYEKAIGYLNNALKESSINAAGDVKTYHLLGQAYAKRLQAQEAVFYFSKALQLSQNFYNVPWMNKTVAEVRRFLQKANFLLEAQRKRQILLNQKNN
jgi:tetratricopeptide (TPR) repeat protein